MGQRDSPHAKTAAMKRPANWARLGLYGVAIGLTVGGAAALCWLTTYLLTLFVFATKLFGPKAASSGPVSDLELVVYFASPMLIVMSAWLCTAAVRRASGAWGLWLSAALLLLFGAASLASAAMSFG